LIGTYTAAITAGAITVAITVAAAVAITTAVLFFEIAPFFLVLLISQLLSFGVFDLPKQENQTFANDIA
jgi:hypothetical protein